MPRKIWRPLLVLGLVLLWAGDAKPLGAQPQNAAGAGKAYRFKIVVRVEAADSNLSRISAMCPVPIDWPEQTVKLISETKPPGSKTREKAVPGMGALWVIECPKLAKGQVLEAERIYELSRTPIVTRLNPKMLKRPTPLPKEYRAFLKSSPGIEVSDPSLERFAERLGREKKSPWEFAHDCSAWIKRNIRYQSGDYEGAKATYEKRRGDCENMSALFVALCRAAEIPARSVWVEGHSYPEFYLEDSRGGGHWIPVQLHAPEAFGTISELRPILQKGDSYHDPVAKKIVPYLPLQVTAFGGTPKLSVENTILDGSADR